MEHDTHGRAPRHRAQPPLPQTEVLQHHAAEVRILVVDDAEPMRFLLGSVFRSLGHDVVTLASGAGVEAAMAAEGVDVVFTDVAMPDGSGCDVLRLIRAGWPALPVVFMTGWDENIRK